MIYTSPLRAGRAFLSYSAAFEADYRRFLRTG
jgi:hypothetical protein